MPCEGDIVPLRNSRGIKTVKAAVPEKEGGQ